MALERHPSVERCVVVVHENAHGDRHLLAYVMPAAGSVVSPEELRLLMHETVPAYMVPSAFVSVASFPLTPSGKLDRKALPPPDLTAQGADAASFGPRTPTEEILALLWCEMLDLKKVGVRDNFFFELGGHSLLAVRVIGRINETLDVKSEHRFDLFRASDHRSAYSRFRAERSIQAGDRGPRVHFAFRPAIQVCHSISLAEGHPNIVSRVQSAMIAPDLRNRNADACRMGGRVIDSRASRRCQIWNNWPRFMAMRCARMRENRPAWWSDTPSQAK